MTRSIHTVYVAVIAIFTMILLGPAMAQTTNGTLPTRAPTGGFDSNIGVTDLKGLFRGQRAVLDEPIPLTKEQMMQIRAAIRDGTVDRICAVLRRNGTIPRVDDIPVPPFTEVFRPIINATTDQQGVIDECFTPPVLPQPQTGRSKRNAPGYSQAADVACEGGVSSVLFVQTPSQGAAQVMTKRIGSAGSCLPSGLSKCRSHGCCKVKFELYALIVPLQTNPTSMTFGPIEVEHCTCVQ